MIGQMKTRLIVHNILIIVIIVTIKEVSATRDADIDRLLKKLNKPAIKSIQSPDGDIIDCVHMKNHPIYDNPLFKNHTIQMRPSSSPEGWNNITSNTKKQSIMVTQLWTINGKCPKNSIPIRRTRREDILRTNSIERYGKKYSSSIFQPKHDNLTEHHEYAIIKVKGKFNGGRALLNVWKPFVQSKIEFSLAQIWVIANAPNSQINVIEAGWQVHPKNYRGDLNPRYFIYWTNDGYQKTGCYNLECSGFIQVNQNFALGARVREVSTLDGEQYHIPTTIWRDTRSGHWWLKFSTDILVGYWPSSLFSHLQNGATHIHWGGEITDYKYGSKHTKTQMGSGHFAQEGYRKASFFRNVEVINERDLPQQPVGVYSKVTQESCYNINLGNHLRWGTFFYYGGPGQNPKCI